MIPTVICDRDLLSLLSPFLSFSLHILSSSLPIIQYPPILSSPQIRVSRYPTSVEKRFPDDIQLAGCLSSHLSHSFDLSCHVRDEGRSLSLSVLNFCLSFSPSACQKHPAPITQVPLLYFIHSSFVPDSMWLSVLLSVFHRHDPHFESGMVCR